MVENVFWGLMGDILSNDGWSIVIAGCQPEMCGALSLFVEQGFGFGCHEGASLVVGNDE